MAKSKRSSKAIESYEHGDKTRDNNPPAGLAASIAEEPTPYKKYHHDPHIDPALSWAGKREGADFEEPTVALHRHEQIDPRVILEAVRQAREDAAQGMLFEAERETPLHKAVEFYQHPHDWSNRLIAGDSLLVMNSLLEKEKMAGKVQCVYIDPPYGIKYGSNFQPFTHQREVKDGKGEHLTREPETIKAFRDTWQLGIHSYLSYLRDRLLLARKLMTESGSCFVQIGDENVHRVGLLMDEVFGAENRVTTITFVTAGGSSSKNLSDVASYLLWYARDKSQLKFRQLYEPLSRREIAETSHGMVELADGSSRKPTAKERFDPDKNLPPGARLYQQMDLISEKASNTGRSEPYEYAGRVFTCRANSQWSVSKAGMDRLAELGRLDAGKGDHSLQWKKYEDEVPGRRINNVWKDQQSASNKRYVVETATKTIQRCLLMSTDPDDLVFDPTCGSGTTAYLAEQWGRRWISCDTSRVALTLAKQRLLTATFDYYQLREEAQGVGGGFVCPTVPNVSARSLAYDQPKDDAILYDQPEKDSKKARVTGPFTVEAVPAPVVLPIDPPQTNRPAARADASSARSGESQRQQQWCDELRAAGVRGKDGQRLKFCRIELRPCRHLHAEAETLAEAGEDGKRVLVAFGPQHAPMTPVQVQHALEEAELQRPAAAIILFAAFQFDPEAAKTIDTTNWVGKDLLRVNMNTDLQTDDLAKNRDNNESFWLVGQPDVIVEPLPKKSPSSAPGGVEGGGDWQIEVRGFDYFDINKGKLTSGGKQDIAAWLLDTDYDGRCLFPRQVFFPMKKNKKHGWTTLAKNLKAEIDRELIEAYSELKSLPFKAGKHQRAAVKIIDARGIESLKIIPLDDKAASKTADA